MRELLLSFNNSNPRSSTKKLNPRIIAENIDRVKSMENPHSQPLWAYQEPTSQPLTLDALDATY
jgi:hypothetical protein